MCVEVALPFQVPISGITAPKKGTAAAAAAKLLQSCSTLCDAIDGSPLGFPVPGILQARTLAISISVYMKELFYQIYIRTFPKRQDFPPLLMDQ